MEYLTVVSKKLNARKFVSRWETQYKNHLFDGTFAKMVLDNVKRLGANPSPDDIEKVIPNSCMLNVKCYVCDSTVEKAIHIESTYINICKCCLEKSLTLLDAHK